MHTTRKSYGRYSGRGVVKKMIALRLRPRELADHESLARDAGLSCAALARLIYLRGIKPYREDAAASPDLSGVNSSRKVNPV